MEGFFWLIVLIFVIGKAVSDGKKKKWKLISEEFSWELISPYEMKGYHRGRELSLGRRFINKRYVLELTIKSPQAWPSNVSIRKKVAYANFEISNVHLLESGDELFDHFLYALAGSLQEVRFKV